MALVLASHSPRRRRLMALVTPDFEVDEAYLDEEAVTAPDPAALAGRLARLKAEAVAARRPRDTVIGCDTVVEAEGKTLGKPEGRARAAAMLEMLSGGCHRVHTGVWVVLPDGTARGFVQTTEVDFAPVPKAEIDAYIQTDEPYDKAGGYGIQGWAAARFVTGIRGDYYNVMGLPVAAVYQALGLLGALDGRAAP